MNIWRSFLSRICSNGSLRFHAEDTPDENLGKLEQMLTQLSTSLEEAVPLFASLLTLPISEHHYPPLEPSPQRQRQKTLETSRRHPSEQAEQQPVLFIVEDLHWTDPTTLELLNLLLDQTPTAAMSTLLNLSSHVSAKLEPQFLSECR